MTKYDRVQEGLVRIELPADGENSKQFPILDIYTDTRCSLLAGGTGNAALRYASWFLYEHIANLRAQLNVRHTH